MEFSGKVKETIAIIGIFTISVSIATFAAYNAGKGDGRKEMLQRIASCTIKDAQTGRCFIPCVEEYDCFLKNGMKEY